MIVLVIGGTRSGKSEIAEQVAVRLGEPVTVVVPGLAGDDEFRARVAVHRTRRPPTWTTVECADHLDDALTAATGTVLVDSLGTWVAATADLTADLTVDPAPIINALRARRGSTVLVSEEVGLSVHPPSESGRHFVDVVGELNRAVADAADEVLFVVAGRVHRLEPHDTAWAAIEGMLREQAPPQGNGR